MNRDRLEDDKPAPTRRVVLCTLAAVPVIPALAACGSTTDTSSGIVDPTVTGDDAGDDTAPPSTCPNATNVGAATAFPAGTFKRAGSGTHTFVVGADAAGIYACSAICTHEGCTNSLRTGGTQYCPCHGAMFDANGKVTRGPASRPLANFLVTICEGEVYVDTTQTVPMGTRVTA